MLHRLKRPFYWASLILTVMMISCSQPVPPVAVDRLPTLSPTPTGVATQAANPTAPHRLTSNSNVIATPKPSSTPIVTATLTSQPTLTPTVAVPLKAQLIPPTDTLTPASDCIAVVVSSNPLTQNEPGAQCWLQLPKGGPTGLTFNERVQITYGTSTDGDDSFFYIAEKGENLQNVIGATVRPMLHVERKFGNLDNLKRREIEYHNETKACLRDANDENKPLTVFCATDTPPPTDTPTSTPSPTSTPTPTSTSTATATPSPTFTPTPTCMTLVTSSRPLTENEPGEQCWLQLSKGGSSDLTFNERVQITYGTSIDGDDSFFYLAEKGESLQNITGATIRPMLHIERKFGSLDALKRHEIEYHNGRTACLRDANDENRSLTAFCATDVTPPPEESDCSQAEIISPAGGARYEDSGNFPVGNRVTVAWEPADCVLIVQYYQQEQLQGEYQDVASGTEIELGEAGSGPTEIKIWKEGLSDPVDNTWVQVQ